MTSKLSLWATPKIHDARVFGEWIEQLAATTGTAVFAPHVTLVGSVPPSADVAPIERALAGFGAFDVTLVGLADSDQHFRCITVLAAADPPLLDLRSALVAACDADSTPYEPHLSLLYADLPSDERRALRATVTLPLPMHVAIDAVCLTDTSDDHSANWSVVRKWPLG